MVDATHNCPRLEEIDGGKGKGLRCKFSAGRGRLTFMEGRNCNVFRFKSIPDPEHFEAGYQNSFHRCNYHVESI